MCLEDEWGLRRRRSSQQVGVHNELELLRSTSSICLEDVEDELLQVTRRGEGAHKEMSLEDIKVEVLQVTWRERTIFEDFVRLDRTKQHEPRKGQGPGHPSPPSSSDQWARRPGKGGRGTLGNEAHQCRRGGVRLQAPILRGASIISWRMMPNE